jgi:hypothetical protein
MKWEKENTIIDWPRPISGKEVQQLLGLWNIYPQFNHNFLGTVSPITDLFWQDREFTWGESQEAASLKMAVILTFGKASILIHYYPNIPTLLETDASAFVIAGILSPIYEDGKMHPVRFVSRTLNPAELNYDA